MTSPVDWDLAERVAVRAAGREPFADSYLGHSLQGDFEEATAEAEALVEQATGLRSLSGPARARVTDRGGWVHANINSFQRLLSPLTDKLGDRMGNTLGGSVTRRVAGLEVGMLLGWMSTRVLGQYDMLIIDDPAQASPDDQDLVYYVGPNVLALEKRFAFPPKQFRLWLALHEVTHRAQFTGVPWLREHFIGLVHETLGAVEPDPQRLVDAVNRLAESIRSGRNPLADGGLVNLIAGPEQRAILDQVSGMMSLLEGHGDVTMDRAGEGLVPSADRFGRVLRQRRESARGLNRLVQQLIGLEAKLSQYAEGEAFIAQVERAGGPHLLERAWEEPANLPSLLEIREPHRWIERMGAALPAAG